MCIIRKDILQYLVFLFKLMVWLTICSCFISVIQVYFIVSSYMSWSFLIKFMLGTFVVVFVAIMKGVFISYNQLLFLHMKAVAFYAWIL